MAINICFSTQTGPLSRVIRWFTRSPVSHAMITFRDATLGKVMVMEATGRGFRMVPWAGWCLHNSMKARFALRVAEDVQLTALQNLAEKLGAEYDYISLLGFLWRRWRKRYDNPLDDAKRLICSEAVATFLGLCGLKMDDPSSYTPNDLFVLLEHDQRVATRLL